MYTGRFGRSRTTQTQKIQLPCESLARSAWSPLLCSDSLLLPGAIHKGLNVATEVHGPHDQLNAFRDGGPLDGAALFVLRFRDVAHELLLSRDATDHVWWLSLWFDYAVKMTACQKQCNVPDAQRQRR